MANRAAAVDAIFEQKSAKFELNRYCPFCFLHFTKPEFIAPEACDHA